MPDQPPPHLTRRELLKLSPLLVLGAVAVPSWTEALLKAGVRWSDAASGLLFRGGHLAAEYPDRDVVPFDQFPYNGFDVMEPEIDFDHWTLKVGGAVAHPGPYTLEQIRGLPKVTQNTRHVCVEGWDVVGRFGGARVSDFLSMVGARPGSRYLTLTCADRYYESLDMETAMQPQSLLCYEMYDSSARSRTWRAAPPEPADQAWLQAGQISDDARRDRRAAGATELLGRRRV